jgi:hypothetical protein
VEFGRYCAERGVERQLTAPYSPQQNGVVEWRNQSVVTMARCMLKAKGLPGYFWGEAVSTAVHILNRSPTRALDGKMPYEAWHGEIPAIHYFRMFGCIAHVKITRLNLKKLDDRSRKAIFVGYEVRSKAYRCYDPVDQHVIISRDVVFDEAGQWHWENADNKQANDSESFIVEYSTETVRDVEPVSPLLTPPPASPPVGEHAELRDHEQEVDDENLDADHDDAPLRLRTIDDLIGDTELPGLARRILNAELNFTSVEEPVSFKEAEQDAAWHAAMRKEMKAIEDNYTWELTSLPVGHRAIGLKWVYKVKHNESGDVVQHKARLVVKGYVQSTGINFDEVFALVAHLQSVRMMVVLAAHEGWEVHHMDVKSAFLNGVIKEEVYVQQPPGFSTTDSENKVLRLHKALYGLRQAPRAWNAKFDSTMGSLGFQRSSSEHGVYTRSKRGGRLIVSVYVDDLIITDTSKEIIDAFKLEMKDRFQMSDLGLLSNYLGIEVKQGIDGISLCQSAYAGKLLERCGLGSCNPSAFPMESRLKLSKLSTAETVNATGYRSVIGALRYLLHTRPDMAFSVGYLSRFMEAPCEDHLITVKRVLRYLAGTQSHGLHYTKRHAGPPKLVGYNDADMGGDFDDRKSTGGIIFFLGGNPITWQAAKQRVVALKSCEAEYVAAAAAACQGVWLARLLTDMIGTEPGAPEPLVDNQSAIALSKNPVLHERSKHIGVRYHYLRECVDEGRIIIDYTATEEQLTDILTKALG